ncbi:hypothetical protein BT96DRAFT_1007006 [Gymnopus androsaceus JB14]|uniref:Uncharacterized protein n=1 Tax=Gymnopus androsaceus JB14 TaxID=1447944 RepID=A0A6A4GIR3_9AGAR|nr:hypothetical protein BT96DRAFT_1007006 [Gymnopus androsaceus JB14]
MLSCNPMQTYPMEPKAKVGSSLQPIPLSSPKGIWCHLDASYTAIEDFANRVMKEYNQPYRRKHEVIVFLGSPLEFESNAWKAADSIIFTCPSTYDTANKEHYLGWFTLTEDYTNFGGVSLLQDPVLDGPMKEFHCEPSTDGRYVDLYSSMGPKECLRNLSEPEPDDTPVALATFNNCNSLLFRDNLVCNIISHVKRDNFILIKAPPCSGKTTLLNSIWDAVRIQDSSAHLEKVDSWGQASEDTPLVIYIPKDCINGDPWLPSMTNSQGLLDFMRLPDRTISLWLFVDKVQKTYRDKTLWNAFFDTPHDINTNNIFVIAAVIPPPKMIKPEFRMTLFNQKMDDRQDTQLSLAFSTEKHFQQYMTLLKAPELVPYWDCIKRYASPAFLQSVENWMPGWHPGVVARMAKFFTNQLKQSRVKQIDTGKFVEDFTSECLHNAKMNITANLGRCIPCPPEHHFNFPPPALMVFHAVLERGVIEVPTIDVSVATILVRNEYRIWNENDCSPALQFGSILPQEITTPGCSPPIVSSEYQMWRQATINTSDMHSVNIILCLNVSATFPKLPMMRNKWWHKHYASYLLRQTPKPNNAFESIDDLLFQAISNFLAKVLEDYRANESMVRETVYEKEFSRTIYALTGPGFAQFRCLTEKGDGYINFKIDSRQWLIELLKEGQKVEKHIHWFEHGEKYGCCWQGWDWRVVDLRVDQKPKIICDCPNFHTVKFDKRGPFMEATIQGGEPTTICVLVLLE